MSYTFFFQNAVVLIDINISDSIKNVLLVSVLIVF